MNTTIRNNILMAITFSSLSFSVHAAEWKTEAEVGLVLTSGNTETQNTNAKLNVVRDDEKWKETANLEALGSSNTDAVTDKNVTTAEKYSASIQADYKLTAANFLFANATYDDDRFSGFDYQATTSLGYGRNIFKNDKQSLSAEAGPGMRFFKVSSVAGVHTPSDDEAILHAAANYIYNFSEQAAFTQDFIVDAGEDLTISESVSAVRAQVTGKMAMKASMKFRNSSEVPAGSEKTDSETALTLVYSF